MYEKMWEGLGLDLKAHQALLDALGPIYESIYLSQKNRPKGMEYFDQVVASIHGARIEELLEAKDAGRLVVGTFCVFVPEEIVWATGGICVGLCAGAEVGFEEAEQVLPRNLCPLIKAFFGFKLARVCPYVEACHFVVGETTCDGKKKAYELFNELKETYVMQVPQKKDAQSFDLWLAEVKRFKEKIEEASGKKITFEDLRRAINLINKRREALNRLNRLRQHDPPPISGLDALLINQIAFYDDPERFTAKLNELCDELEERIKRGHGVLSKESPRIIISGCPMAIPNWKLPYIVESLGAVIVGEESCVGRRNTRDLVNPVGETIEDLLRAIAERYMKIDCAIFTPNPDRAENLRAMVEELSAHGVIHYSLKFCDPYTIEVYQTDRAISTKVPTLKIETDYSQEDIEQIRTRVEAFLELLR